MDAEECFVVSEDQAGHRLDQILAWCLPDYSRARLQAWIKQGRVAVDDQQLPPKARLSAGAAVAVRIPPPEPEGRVVAQDIPLDVVYEDEDLLIVNKPAGLTVHPGAGQPDGTLQNALLHHRPNLESVPRAGIVHRLDKDTTGVMMVAATLPAHTALVRALQARDIRRDYLALVWGVPVAGGTVDAALARHPRDRLRFTVSPGGRHAVTHYRVRQKFARISLLELQLETGRTHQIRVHMQHKKMPLLGDPLYGRRGDPYRQRLGRQALHAVRLSLSHPRTHQALTFSAPIPADMAALIGELQCPNS